MIPSTIMPPSRLESLPRELREHIYFYLDLPIGGKCIHNCHRTFIACELSCDMSVARHPRAKPHYVDIWDQQERSGGPGLVLLEVRSVGIGSGKVEGVDVFKHPAVCIALLSTCARGLACGR
jgi:hypothetical protein